MDECRQRVVIVHGCWLQLSEMLSRSCYVYLRHLTFNNIYQMYFALHLNACVRANSIVFCTSAERGKYCVVCWFCLDELFSIGSNQFSCRLFSLVRSVEDVTFR